MNTRNAYDQISGCRSCGNPNLKLIIHFGKTPIADALLKKEQFELAELLVPLDLCYCPNCTLVQITETVNPEILFCRDYPYFSSTSKAYREDQIYWHLEWEKGLKNIYELINKELEKQ